MDRKIGHIVALQERHDPRARHEIVADLEQLLHRQDAALRRESSVRRHVEKSAHREHSLAGDQSQRLIRFSERIARIIRIIKYAKLRDAFFRHL